MKYVVESYNSLYGCYRCGDKTGKHFYVDLPTYKTNDPESIVGATIEIENLDFWLTIYVPSDNKIKIVNPAPPKTEEGCPF